ncbi:MAG: AMP-binding protein [Promethearchaeota archaeon]
MVIRKFKMSPFVDSVAIRAKYFPKEIPAIIYGDVKITWSELYDRVCRLANGIKDKVKIKKGDKIAFVFHNGIQFVEINFASQMLGAVPVPVNYRYVASEYEYTINDCDAVVLICEESVIDEILKIKSNLNKVKLFAVDSDEALEGFIRYKDLVNYHTAKEFRVKVNDEDLGVIIYTGGTTGRSKGVMLSNRNILTNQEGVLRALIRALPQVDLKCTKFASSPGERKYMKAFDIFNSYFEGLLKDEKYKDTVLVLDVLGNEDLPDVSVTMVNRENSIKLMYGAPPKDQVNIKLVSAMKEHFRSLTNILPYAYTKKGRRKALVIVFGKMLKREIKFKGKLNVKMKLIKSLMKTSRDREGTDRSDEFLSLLIVPPMFHLAAYAFFLMFATYVGGTCIFPEKWSFSAEDILKMIEKHRPKWILLVPTMYKEVIEYIEANPDHGYDISSVRIALSGAALLKGEDKKRLLKCFPNTVVIDAFGQTEMSAIAAMKIDTDPEKVKHGSVGKLGPGLEAKIVDDFGNECPEGKIGEIYYRGKSVMKGYYGDNEKTARTIDKDGWLHSGDLGYIKDGELFIVDRKGECINTGGEKVYPLEVEEIIQEHPAVNHVCVIGVPDEKWGSIVRAVIELKEGMNATEEEIIEFCKGKMAGYKKPKSVIFVDKLPISPVGKVQRGVIRKLYGQPKVND